MNIMDMVNDDGPGRSNSAFEALVELAVTSEPMQEVVPEEIVDEPRQEVVAEEIADEPRQEVVAEEIADEPMQEVVAEEITDEPMQEVVAEEIAEPIMPAAVVPAINKKPPRIRKTPVLPQKKTWLITHGIGGVQITKEMIKQTFRGIELYECYTIHDRLHRHTIFRVISKAGGVLAFF